MVDQLKKLKKLAGIKQHVVSLEESINNKIVIRRTIDPPALSADDWELYTNEEGAEEAAQAINNALAEAVNAGLPPDQVEDHMHKIMLNIRGFGALDTEPRAVLRTILSRIYGKDYQD